MYINRPCRVAIKRTNKYKTYKTSHRLLHTIADINSIFICVPTYHSAITEVFSERNCYQHKIGISCCRCTRWFPSCCFSVYTMLWAHKETTQTRQFWFEQNLDRWRERYQKTPCLNFQQPELIWASLREFSKFKNNVMHEKMRRNIKCLKNRYQCCKNSEK